VVSRHDPEILTGTLITPANEYVECVIPAQAGIHNKKDWMPDQVGPDDCLFLSPD
jgi:hypothetical protein